MASWVSEELANKAGGAHIKPYYTQWGKHEESEHGSMSVSPSDTLEDSEIYQQLKNLIIKFLHSWYQSLWKLVTWIALWHFLLHLQQKMMVQQIDKIDIRGSGRNIFPVSGIICESTDVAGCWIRLGINYFVSIRQSLIFCFYSLIRNVTHYIAVPIFKGYVLLYFLPLQKGHQLTIES